MLYLDPHRIIENRIAESMGFDKYKMIIEHVRKVDVSADLDFQRTYNGFYRIRRNAEWRAAYYGLFEEIKNSSPTFEQIIRAGSLCGQQSMLEPKRQNEGRTTGVRHRPL